jgi:hypothetical protein
MDWRYGSSSRVTALKAQSPEFKPPVLAKIKKKKKKRAGDVALGSIPSTTKKKKRRRRRRNKASNSRPNSLLSRPLTLFPPSLWRKLLQYSSHGVAIAGM